MTTRSITFAELAKHNSKGDCWVAINGKVYDLTTFLSEHPAGPGVILKQAGKDGTEAFEPFHSNDIIETLGKESLCVGVLDQASEQVAGNDKAPAAATTTSLEKKKKPPLGAMLNVFDFEEIAKGEMTPEGWAYYSSGADDEITFRENHAAFHRVFLKPRVLVNVAQVHLGSRLLSHKVSFPVYVTATALAKLAHKDGELALSRACAKRGIVYMLPTLGSFGLSDMMGARVDGQVQFFQLYVNSDREVTRKLVKKAEDGGCKALCITVDAPMLGRREKDMRFKFVEEAPDVQKESGVNRSGGTARAISQFIDPSLCWDDLRWFKSITNMPILLKGVQCGEDALLAYQHGVQGVIVSNHGGRQLDFARSGVEMLEEVITTLKTHNVDLNKFTVCMDGGVRRGSDVFKAIALGARGVGIGRPTLYGLAAYGQAGVERVLQILEDELRMCMSLMGTPTIQDINPSHVITSSLSQHPSVTPKDHLSEKTYISLDVVQRSNL